MNEPLEFLVQLLSQFAGGPGPPENNLVRFGLAAVFWAVLLFVAGSRQKQQSRPREKLLVAGFALAFIRELFMFAQQSWRIVSGAEHDALCTVTAPLEHSLTLAALVLIAGSFLRYLLDDDHIARTYLTGGLGAVALLSAVTFLWWPGQLAANPHLHFSATWPAWALHLLAATMLVIALAILVQKQGWLRNVIIVALLFFVLSELLTLANLATARQYSRIICPIGNSFYLWAIPLFGFVYFREQSLEKKRAEEALQNYQDHLEELVDERTADLAQAHAQLERAAALEERQRIAANLHDGLAQTLSYVHMISTHTESLLASGDVVAAQDGFTRVGPALSRALAEVRNCVRTLHETPAPPQGLESTVRQDLEDLRPIDGPQIEFVSYLQHSLLEKPERLEHIRRVMTEAVMNALRHADASVITVTVEDSPAAATITVLDDGCGFDPERASKDQGEHFGLSIMKARAAQLGGTLQIYSALEQGTQVMLTWPIESDLTPGSTTEEMVETGTEQLAVDKAAC